jgi:hypothetical protein
VTDGVIINLRAFQVASQKTAAASSVCVAELPLQAPVVDSLEPFYDGRIEEALEKEVIPEVHE